MLKDELVKLIIGGSIEGKGLKFFKIVLPLILLLLIILCNYWYNYIGLFFDKTRVDAWVYLIIHPHAQAADSMDRIVIRMYLLPIILIMSLGILKLLIKDRYLNIGFNITIFLIFCFLLYVVLY